MVEKWLGYGSSTRKSGVVFNEIKVAVVVEVVEVVVVVIILVKN